MKIKYLFIVSLFLVVLNMLQAQEKTVVLGGKAGWAKFQSQKGISKGKGRFGYESIELETNSSRMDSLTDILIDFEDATSSDLCGNYSVVKNNAMISPDTKMGKKCGLFKGKGGVRLSGSSESIFGKSGTTGSWTIDFWLNPSIAENGEIIFSWRSSRTVASYPLYQMITASILNNHMNWSFINVFDGWTKDEGELSITSYRTIIPNQWAFHSISYDESTGLLEYKINGSTEAICYVTTNGREHGGSAYTPVLGVIADIEICASFTGLIDDFRIQKKAENEKSLENIKDNYLLEGGEFISEPIMLSSGAQIKKIEALFDKPSQTEVEFFIRSGENFYDWNNQYPEWKQIESGEELSDVHGLYFQIKTVLYPDGGGTKTPSVSEIKLTYQEIPLPLAPFELYATPGNGEVVLSWPYAVDETVGGYYIFYGNRSGEYLGREAVQGHSPIQIGNVTSITLSGLKNGRIYYFAVASYSNKDSAIMGELSKEVFVRPKAR